MCYKYFMYIHNCNVTLIIKDVTAHFCSLNLAKQRKKLSANLQCDMLKSLCELTCIVRRYMLCIFKLLTHELNNSKQKNSCI